MIAVAWQFSGLSPADMSSRIVTNHERMLTTSVNDIEYIESQSLQGIGIIKIYFQPGTDIRIATSQVTSASQTALRQMSPEITSPLILNYNASTMPILQLALSGKGLSEQHFFDNAVNQVRPPLGNIPAIAIPYPSGGRQRTVPNQRGLCRGPQFGSDDGAEERRDLHAVDRR